MNPIEKCFVALTVTTIVIAGAGLAYLIEDTTHIGKKAVKSIKNAINNKKKVIKCKTAR